MDAFNALDEKIKSGEYNDDEENRFGELSHLYAKKLVEGFKQTSEA